MVTGLHLQASEIVKFIESSKSRKQYDLNTEQTPTSTEPWAHRIPTLISMAGKPCVGDACQRISYWGLIATVSHYFSFLRALPYVGSL